MCRSRNVVYVGDAANSSETHAGCAKINRRFFCHERLARSRASPSLRWQQSFPDCASQSNHVTVDSRERKRESICSRRVSENCVSPPPRRCRVDYDGIKSRRAALSRKSLSGAFSGDLKKSARARAMPPRSLLYLFLAAARSTLI